ncbi:ap2 domain transcription factor ap2xii-5 [Cystoisospora suis]|uniref:Ap2 domain transcription factor ap2xii-5 n=1 Tax=Cystoisospora suis TaxID=483139 RepID=A0A2C6LFI5_9APIC|nr:ap2 domain transcription factor ap2xii-5 [Cystoisospora suis]
MSNQDGFDSSLREPSACNVGSGSDGCSTSEKRKNEVRPLSPSSFSFLSPQCFPTSAELGSIADSCEQLLKPFYHGEQSAEGSSSSSPPPPRENRTPEANGRLKGESKAISCSSSSASSPEGRSHNELMRRHQGMSPHVGTEQLSSAAVAGHSVPDSKQGRSSSLAYRESDFPQCVSSRNVTCEDQECTDYAGSLPHDLKGQQPGHPDPARVKGSQRTSSGSPPQRQKLSVTSPRLDCLPVLMTPQKEAVFSTSPTPPFTSSDHEEGYEYPRSLKPSDNQRLPLENFHSSSHWRDRSPSNCENPPREKSHGSLHSSLPPSVYGTAMTPDVKLTVGACHASSPPSVSLAPSLVDGEEEGSRSPRVPQHQPQQASESVAEEMQEEGTYTSSSQDYGDGGGTDGGVQEEKNSFSVDTMASTSSSVKEPGRGDEEYKGGNHSRSLSPSYYQAQLDRCPKVVGVRFDKTQCRWLAGISVNGKTMNKYFPVYKYGFDGARRMAVNHRLACLRNQGKSALAASVAAAAAQLERDGGDDGVGEERLDNGEDMLSKGQGDEELHRSEHQAERSRPLLPGGATGASQTSGRPVSKEGVEGGVGLSGKQTEGSSSAWSGRTRGVWRRRTLEDDSFEAFFSYEGGGAEREEEESKEADGEYRAHYQGPGYRSRNRSKPCSTGGLYGRGKTTRDRDGTADPVGGQSHEDRDADSRDESQEQDNVKKQTFEATEIRRTTHNTAEGGDTEQQHGEGGDREQGTEGGEKEALIGADDCSPSFTGPDPWGCNRRGSKFRNGRASVIQRGGRGGPIKSFASRHAGQAPLENESDFADGEGEGEMSKITDKGVDKVKEKDGERESLEADEREVEEGRLSPLSAGSSASPPKSGSWSSRPDTRSRPRGDGSAEGGGRVKGGRGVGEGYSDRDGEDGSRSAKKRCIGSQRTPSISGGEEEDGDMMRKEEENGGEERKGTLDLEGNSIQEKAALAENLRPWPEGLWWSRADSRWVVVCPGDAGDSSEGRKYFIANSAGGVGEAYRLACAFLDEAMRKVGNNGLSDGSLLPSERDKGVSSLSPRSSSTSASGPSSTRHGMCTRGSGRERGRSDEGVSASQRHDEGETDAEDEDSGEHVAEGADVLNRDRESTGSDTVGNLQLHAKGRGHTNASDRGESKGGQEGEGKKRQSPVGDGRQGICAEQEKYGSSVLWRVKEDTAATEGIKKKERFREKEEDDNERGSSHTDEGIKLSSLVLEGKALHHKSTDVSERKYASDEDGHEQSSVGKECEHSSAESPAHRQESFDVSDSADFQTSSSGANKICTRGMSSASLNDRSCSRSGHHLRHQSTSALASSVSTALARRRWGSSAAIVASGADAWARQALKLPLYPGMQYDAISKCFRVKLRNHRRAFSVVRRGVREAHILAVEALMSEGLLDKKNEDDFRSFYREKESFALPDAAEGGGKLGDRSLLPSGDGGMPGSAGMNHTGGFTTRRSFSHHSRGYRDSLGDHFEEEGHKASSSRGGCGGRTLEERYHGGGRGREESVLSPPTSFSPHPPRKGSGGATVGSTGGLGSTSCHGMATRGSGQGAGGGVYTQSRGGAGGYQGTGHPSSGGSSRGSYWGSGVSFHQEGRTGDTGARHAAQASNHNNTVGRHSNSRGDKWRTSSAGTSGGGSFVGAAPGFDEEGDNKGDDDAFLPLGGLGLTKNAIVICLTDMRDNCLPMCFASFNERAERRRMIQRHIAHIQDATRRETVLPYLHLFECLLLLNRLPHEVEYSTQRILFSALDMHARAAIHTYFPGYFTGSAGALGVLWGEDDSCREPVDPSSLEAELVMDDDDYMRR